MAVNESYNPIFMKKNYLFLLLTLCYAFNSYGQALSVTASPVLSTVCASNSTQITANASPVGYSMSTISYNLVPSPGGAATNVLATGGAFVVTQSAGINLDDCRWDNISLPFTFNLYGTDYTSVNISSNGWIALGTTSSVTTGYNVALANAAAPNAVIHAITADLDLRTASGGTVEYFEDGSFPNRSFVVLYTDVKFNGGGATIATVEVILKENNEVEIHTEKCNNTTKNKAQGIENSTGSLASVVTGRNNTLTWSGMPNAVLFTPDQFTYSWSGAGLSATTGKIVTATPPVTTTYNITATRVSDNATANNTVTINVDPASYTLANTPVAGGGSYVAQNVSVAAGGTYYRNGNCNLIALITPSGANPVNNSINTSVRLDTGATKKGTADLYAARVYDMEPIFSAGTATATVTLFYLQSEFNKFNVHAFDSGHALLPTGPGDAAGISNLMIKQFHGTGTMPGAYSAGTYDSFTTASAGVTVTWNSTRSWWEVQVPVVGFSGFYLTSKKSGSLPIKLEYFRGSHSGNSNVLDWKVNCTSIEAKFEIERGTDGKNFNVINTFSASQLRCLQAFDLTDAKPLNGLNYYRLKMIDVDGKASYSNIVVLVNKESGFEIASLTPTLIHKEKAVLSLTATQKTNVTIIVTDIAGKLVQKQTASLNNGTNNIQMNFDQLAAGTYQVTGYTSTGKSRTVRFVKE